MSKHIALLLAAGFSTRFGSDKRLSGDSTPLLIQSLNKITPLFKDIVVVLRHQDEAMQTLIQNDHVTFTHALKDDIGLGVSIACGGRLIAQKFEGDVASISVFLADMPYISPITITKILQASKTNNIVRPKVLKQQGHPVCFGADFISDLCVLKEDVGASQIIKLHTNCLQLIDVDDLGIIKDIDTRSDWLS